MSQAAPITSAKRIPDGWEVRINCISFIATRAGSDLVTLETMFGREVRDEHLLAAARAAISEAEQ